MSYVLVNISESNKWLNSTTVQMSIYCYFYTERSNCISCFLVTKRTEVATEWSSAANLVKESVLFSRSFENLLDNLPLKYALSRVFQWQFCRKQIYIDKLPLRSPSVLTFNKEDLFSNYDNCIWKQQNFLISNHVYCTENIMYQIMKFMHVWSNRKKFNLNGALVSRRYCNKWTCYAFL